jgi:hypothetical protein
VSARSRTAIKISRLQACLCVSAQMKTHCRHSIDIGMTY